MAEKESLNGEIPPTYLFRVEMDLEKCSLDQNAKCCWVQ